MVRRSGQTPYDLNTMEGLESLEGHARAFLEQAHLGHMGQLKNTNVIYLSRNAKTKKR